MSAAQHRYLAMDVESLDRLMPMHLLIDPDGTILRTGPTLARLRLAAPFEGAAFFDRFDLRRPHCVSSVSELAGASGARLRLVLRDEPRTSFKGHAVGIDGVGILVNLSFGITVAEAVTTYGLTASDFAPTELAVEMLYLIEAKSAAMEESRRLNERLRGAKAVAEQQAFTDALTGVRNRRGMDALMADLIERQAKFGVMHVDLDYFKAVNDSLGHAAGDHVLVHVARLLESETRESDSVIRVGGDEFVIILRDLADETRLRAIAERIIERLEDPVIFDGHECRVSASIGMTLSTRYGTPEVERILRDADEALYDSKQRGRSRATLFSDPGAGGTPGLAPERSAKVVSARAAAGGLTD